MPRHILHHNGQFLEWSTVTAAPATYAASALEFSNYYRSRYGNDAMKVLLKRLRLAAKFGTSLAGCSVEDLVQGNRAGPRGTELSREDIIRFFFIERRDPAEEI